MQTSQFTKCSDCNTLEDIYNKINCSIYQLIRNKWVGQTYNTDAYFNSDQYQTLLRLKRIIYKRLYNPLYPTACFENEDIITVAIKELYNSSSCPECPCEDFTDFIPTTTSTSTTTSTTSTTTSTTTTTTTSTTTLAP